MLWLAVMSVGYAEADIGEKAKETVGPQISEGLVLVGGPRAAVTEYFNDHGRLPLNNEKSGIAEPYLIEGRYVVSVTVTDGTISIMFGMNSSPEIYGHTLEFIPEVVDDGLSWTCVSYTIADKYLPRGCRKRK